MGEFGGGPLVSGDDGDAEDFGSRRLDEEEDGLLIGAGRAGGVLVDDDFTFLSGGEGREQ